MADATLTAQLVLDTRNFYNSLRSAESDASKFTSRIETSVSKTSNTFTNLWKSMQQGFKDTSTAATTFNTTLGKTERGFTSLSNKFQSVFTKAGVAGSSISGLSAVFDKLKGVALGAGGVIGEISKALSSIGGPAMIAVAAIGALVFAWDQAKKGFEASRIDTMFKNSAEIIGRDADKLSARLSRAMGATVEDTEMKFVALKANLIGMSEDSLVKFAEAAKTAATVTGESATEMLRGFIQTSMTMRVRAVAQLGMFSQDELTILQESVKNHKLTQDELSDIINSRSKEWKIALDAPRNLFILLGVAFSEFWEELIQKPLGGLLSPFVEMLIDALNLLRKLGPVVQTVFSTIGEVVSKLYGAFKELISMVSDFTSSVFEKLVEKIKWVISVLPKGSESIPEETGPDTAFENAKKLAKQRELDRQKKETQDKLQEKWQQNYNTQMEVESVAIRINKLQGQQKVALESINILTERGYDKYVAQEERLKVQWKYEEQILKAKIEQAAAEAKKVPEAEAGAKATADAKVAIAKQELETARQKHRLDVIATEFDRTFVKSAREKYEQAAGLLKVEKERIDILNSFNEEQLQNQITLGLKDELDLVKQKFQYEIDSLQVQEKQIKNQLDNTQLTREQRIELEAQIKLLEEKGIKLFSQMKDNTAIATRNAKLALGGYAALNQQLIEIENARKRDLEVYSKKYPQYVKDIEMRAQEQRESALSSYYELVIKYNRNIQDMWNNTGRLMVLQTRNIWQTTSQLIQDTFSNLRSTIQDALFGWMVNEGDDLKGYINKFARSMAASLSASIAEDLDTMLKEFVFGKKVDMAIKAQNVYVNGMPIGGYQGEEKKGLADKLKEMFGLDTSTGENEIPPQDTVLDKVANSIEDTWTEITDWWDSLDVTDALQGVELSINNAFSIVSSMLTAMIEKIVSDQGGFSSMFSGFGGGGFDLFELFGGGSGMFFHQGGVVGTTNVPRKRVNPLLFFGAPRLHGGLMPGEYPAVLQQGETVVPRGGFAGQQTVVYNIYANDSKSFSESMRENRAIIHKEVVNGLRDNKTRHDMNRFLGRR